MSRVWLNPMESTPITVGDRLAGRYLVEAVLGAGGMSTVYRARDESLARTVAIKVFRSALSDPKALQRQRSEVQLIASFEHPSLVTLYDATVLEETSKSEHAFLVMQFVDGEDLGDEISHGPLSQDRTMAIGADIADALSYVHEQGVIHRDVKPGNILVPRETRANGPRALLADFGIARFLDGLSLTATGSVLGTANYLSPEQALGRELTAATDVYALGLVLIEALSGERAFGGSGMESVAARLASDPKLPAAASAPLLALLRSMTQREPGARPSAAEVHDRLGELATTAELPVTAALAPADVPTVAMAATPEPTRVMPPVADPTTYAATTIMPDPDGQTTTVLAAAATRQTPTRRTSTARPPRRALLAGLVVLVLAIVVVLAVALPHSSPASLPTPSTSNSRPATPSPAATGTTTPVVVETPVTTSVATTPPAAPTKNKPGKGKNGNGKGHGKKP
ncbi:hypothetical protein BH11ACT2_BH11ACT2_11610 [soil metagenome]